MVLAINAKFTVTVSFVEKNCWLLVKFFTMTRGHLGKGNIGVYIGRNKRQKNSILFPGFSLTLWNQRPRDGHFAIVHKQINKYINTAGPEKVWRSQTESDLKSSPTCSDNFLSMWFASSTGCGSGPYGRLWNKTKDVA